MVWEGSRRIHFSYSLSRFTRLQQSWALGRHGHQLILQMPEDSIPEQRKALWMDTGVPGPNVVVPTSLLPQWSGSQPPKDGRTIQARFRWKRLRWLRH